MGEPANVEMVSTTLSTGKNGVMWSLRKRWRGVTEVLANMVSETVVVRENSSTVGPTAAMIRSVQTRLKSSLSW